ncbi:MAG: hypothetical protein GXP25_01335 [Planctomycetes bacterium]|nr:hypothetical protein [Planctomycetota bacterium]
MAGCSSRKEGGPVKGSFADDVGFLKKHTDVIVLSNDTGNAQVAVCPEYQGRVMTSSAGGSDGLSFGWINREWVAAKKRDPHINVFGGEDRFWLGPEGGQYSIFFKKGDPFDLEHWHTPAAIDWGGYDIASQGKTEAVFKKAFALKNYSDFEFTVEVNRKVGLYDTDGICKALGIKSLGGAKAVGYFSDNKIANTGKAEWKKGTGLLSIWILGMFTPSPDTTIVLPFKAGAEDKLGPIVNDAYFGKVPADRLIIKDGVMFFKGDGKYRSKIGISPKRAKEIVGSYDAGNGVLTLVKLTLPGTTDYVNSMWEIQKEPYAGDTVNSYNDGPPEPGAKPMGPFYELETSSPAAALKPAESLSHVHSTFHIQGSEADLNPIAKATLGVSIVEIKAAFGK